MTRRQGRSVENDPGVAALLDCDSDAIVFVAKAWDYQVRVALRSTEEDNLAAITQSVQAAIKRGKEAAVDCEHFFDGFKANEAYALACAKVAVDAGARWIVLCDTNGGSLPHEIERIVTRVRGSFPAKSLAFTRMTTRARRSPIRSPPCAPARARFRARSTAWASVAATPI